MHYLAVLSLLVANQGLFLLLVAVLLVRMTTSVVSRIRVLLLGWLLCFLLSHPWLL
jgi:4-amino-4-deoxy-L-arabinose transferase-like glycosyltransferase